MILVNLKGGLGNQMFQYACGRAMAMRGHKVQASHSGDKTNPLKLDTSGFARIADSDTPRTFRLDMFNIQAEVATQDEISAVKYPFGILSKGWRFFNAKILRRFYISFDPTVLSWIKNPDQNIYLDGFFQSEEYFKDFADQLRADFTPSQPLGPTAQALFDKISRDPYGVSVHIRRGDYASEKTTNSFWGTCDIEYYKRAVAEIAVNVPKPNIYVFSDDIEWAKINLSLGFPTIFVSAPDIADFEEILLMSACRHNIIANSSFSWWGAWLNANPSKTVIAPTRWSNLHNDDWYKDIIPNTWKRM